MLKQEAGMFKSVYAAKDVALEYECQVRRSGEGLLRFMPRSMARGRSFRVIGRRCGRGGPKENLYLLYVCPYEELYLKPSPVTKVETNELWNWDVAELFIGSRFQQYSPV